MKKDEEDTLKAQTSQQGRRIILRIARANGTISKEVPGNQTQAETDTVWKSVVKDENEVLKNKVKGLKNKLKNLKKSHEDLKTSFEDFKNIVQEKLSSQNHQNIPQNEKGIEISNNVHNSAEPFREKVEMDHSDFQNPYSFEQPMKKIKSEYGNDGVVRVQDQSAEIQRLNEIIKKLKEENVKLIKDNRNLTHGHGSKKG